MLFAILLSFFGAGPAQAFEVMDATVLCDRFIGGPERDTCMRFVKDRKPDTYVSSVCHYMFDDKVFNDCLKLAVRISVNPKELTFCDGTDMADGDRLACIKNRSRAGKEFQRLPASISKKKTSESKSLAPPNETKAPPPSSL